MINANRLALGQMDGIYFVAPTDNNINRIIQV